MNSKASRQCSSNGCCLILCLLVAVFSQLAVNSVNGATTTAPIEGSSDTTIATTTAATTTAATTTAATTTFATTTAATTTAATTTFATTTVATTSAAATTSTAATTTSTTTATTATTTIPFTSTTVSSSYLISLILVWNGEDVTSETSRQFNTLIMPAIKSVCPLSLRVNNTQFNLIAAPIDTLPTLDQVSAVQKDLTERNFLFVGEKSSSLTPLVQSVVATTTVPGYANTVYHTIAPIPLDLLQDALIKVISQRISEGLYPSDPRNFRAALFIDDTLDITQMTALFSFFKNGLMFFRYTSATVQASLLEVKNQGLINIIALLPATMGDGLKVAAFNLNMLTYQYRWFFHGPRLVNAPIDTRMVTYSTNITSLEFGRIQDTLRKDLRTTSAVLVYDLLTVWQFYLQQYLCNESSPVNTTYRGYSGQFRLLPNGTMIRLNWQLQIYRGLEAKQQQIGEWSSDGVFSMLTSRDPARTPDMSLTELKFNQFRMVTIITPPYVMYKPDAVAGAPLKESLTGMYIELCKQMLSNLGFTNYDFYLQPDNAYGVFNKTWNGIIKTMMDGRAHLACAPITIETSRKEAVSFSNVVHTSAQSIVYKVISADAFQEMFQFLQPLDSMIWFTVLAVLVYVAVVLAIMHWIIPNKGIQLKLYDSLFFSFAEVVQGTSGSVPNQLSGRIVVAFFWFFTLFLLLTYIANYAALRVLDGVQQQVDSLQTLLQNSAYQFGSVRNTITFTLLQTSTFVYMQQMYGLMTDTFPNGMVANTSVAVQVMQSQNTTNRYALIGDNLQNQYLADTNCNLLNTGQFYQLKSALVYPTGIDYGIYFDSEIIKLSSKITSLQQQYFSVASNMVPDCADRSFLGYIRTYTSGNLSPVKDGALTVSNTLGISMINLFGCIFALLLSAVERCFGRLLQKRSETRRKNQVSEAFAMSQRPTLQE